MKKDQNNSGARDKLLDAAENLMLAKGFGATTVDEICRRAKLTKGSFFHYFKSKDDLGKAVLERFCRLSRDTIKTCCDHHDEKSDPLMRVYAHMDLAVESARDPKKNKGCLIGTFAQELSDTHPEMRVLCDQGFRDWTKMIEADLSKVKARYAPKANIDVRSLAEHFVAVVEGSQILAKVKKDPEVMEKNMAHFKQYLGSLFKK